MANEEKNVVTDNLYVMLRHDFEGLGHKGQIVTKKAFDAFVREQNDYLERFIASKGGS